MTKQECLAKVFHVIQYPKLPPTATLPESSTDPSTDSQTSSSMEIAYLLSDTEACSPSNPSYRTILCKTATHDALSKLVVTLMMFQKLAEGVMNKYTDVKGYQDYKERHLSMNLLFHITHSDKRMICFGIIVSNIKVSYNV